MCLYNISLKKGGGGLKFNIGGGMSQKQILTTFENTMAVTAKHAAELLNTSYNTYKEWKGERRNMTGPSIRLIEVLMDIKGTGFGKKFGV